jgi:Sulfotransferase family
MNKDKAPVFIVGCPRSGTTLLYHMLLSSGQFAVYRMESSVFNLLEPTFGDLAIRRHRRKLLDAWLKSRLFSRSGLNAEQIATKVLTECKNAGDFLNFIMEEIARNQNIERWADCTPEHVLYLSRIKSTIPNALVIHLIRDGRDVALSYSKQGWLRPMLWDRSRRLLVAGLYWEWIVRKGRDEGRSLGNQYIEMRFEDLVGNPRESLAQISRFIDCDLDYDHILQVGIGSVTEPNTSFKEMSPEAGFRPAGRWRTTFPRDQLAALEELVGPLLTSLGYLLATEPASVRPTRRALRTFYRSYFGFKHLLRTKTPLGRMVANKDLSWL